MGTNFFWKDLVRPGSTVEDNDNRYDPWVHIGKRNAAGPYCFDCGVTLVHNDIVTQFSPYGGRNKLVHTGQAGQSTYCPQCLNEAQPETLESSAAESELGFREGPPTSEERQGVRSCSSFVWAQDPGWVLSKLLAALKNDDSVAVVNEYGDEYTAHEFLENILAACPIWFTNSVGTEFS